MTQATRKIRLSNDRLTGVTLSLEPHGEDYAMHAGEQFEIVAAGAGDDFYFHVCFDEDRVIVHAEGDAGAEPRVCRDGEPVSCERKRR